MAKPNSYIPQVDDYCPHVEDMYAWYNAHEQDAQDVLSGWRDAIIKYAHGLDTESILTTLNSDQTAYSFKIRVPVVFHLIHMGEKIGTGMNLDYRFVPYILNLLNNKINKTAEVSESSHGNKPSLNINFLPARIDENKNILTEPGLNRIDGSDLSYNVYNPIQDSVKSRDYVREGVSHRQFRSDIPVPGIPETEIKERFGWDTDRFFNIYLVNCLNDKPLKDIQSLYGSSTLPFINEHSGQDNLFGIVFPIKSLGIPHTRGLVFNYIANGKEVLSKVNYGGKEEGKYFETVNKLEGNALLHNILHCFGLIDLHFPALKGGCPGTDGAIYNSIDKGGSLSEIPVSYKHRYVENPKVINTCLLEKIDYVDSQAVSNIFLTPGNISPDIFEYDNGRGNLFIQFKYTEKLIFRDIEINNYTLKQGDEIRYTITDRDKIKEILNSTGQAKFLNIEPMPADNDGIVVDPTPPEEIPLPEIGDYTLGGIYMGLITPDTVASNPTAHLNVPADERLYETEHTHGSLNEPYLLICAVQNKVDAYNSNIENSPMIGIRGDARTYTHNYPSYIAPARPSNLPMYTNGYSIKYNHLPWLNMSEDQIGVLYNLDDTTLVQRHYQFLRIHNPNHFGVIDVLGEWDLPWVNELQVAIANAGPSGSVLYNNINLESSIDPDGNYGQGGNPQGYNDIWWIDPRSYGLWGDSDKVSYFVKNSNDSMDPVTYAMGVSAHNLPANTTLAVYDDMTIMDYIKYPENFQDYYGVQDNVSFYTVKGSENLPFVHRLFVKRLPLNVYQSQMNLTSRSRAAARNRSRYGTVSVEHANFIESAIDQVGHDEFRVKSIDVSYEVSLVKDNQIRLNNITYKTNFEAEEPQPFDKTINHPMHHSFLSFDIKELNSVELTYIRSAFAISYVLHNLSSSNVYNGIGCDSGGLLAEYDTIIDSEKYENTSGIKLEKTLDDIRVSSRSQMFVTSYNNKNKNFRKNLNSLQHNI